MYSQYHLQRQPQANQYQPQAAPPPSESSYSPESSSMPASPLGSLSDSRTRHGSDLIGRSIHFPTGPYAGRTIRMELQEIQSANLGRKYARVDRRPLDPPPVVHLKMFEMHTSDANGQYEQEMAYDSDVQVLGLLCTVDLFPVPAPESSPLTGGNYSAGTSSAPTTQTAFHSPSPSSSSTYSCEHNLDTHYPDHPSILSALPSKAPDTHFSGYIAPPRGTPDVVHHWHSFPITEASKETQALVGATFVQPNVIDYMGNKAIVFVFADLAVKIEGTFILRYRVFDIFSRPYSQSTDLSIMAECYGDMFRVYSTKEFPGLSASTELTKLLARWGVRLNIRETERRRRKRPAASGGRRSPTPDGDT